ncbi:acyl-[acyl-carrier-protein] thioesterase [Leuconostoc miyukkimchii]|uniref:acyl-[acyl-carrier-protein] thioesterase n=1 Tax=Leuconostoc miyukkimchii TaxID=910540 RepID=UPI001C7D03A4|nr:acyl-ACP thioesterase domain-containing protein [Leuconostoc miyukkimchii]
MRTFEIKRHVEYYEADTTGKLSLPMILNWAVLASKKQSDTLGVGPKSYMSRGLGWVILQYEVDIVRRPEINEEITIKTFAAKYNPFFVSRPFTFFDSQGHEIIHVKSIWTMIDIDNRRMARLPQDIVDAYQAERVKQIPRIAKPTAVGVDEVFEEKSYHVRYLDIDANKHVNNSKYFEWMQDVLSPNFLSTHEITYLNLKYEAEVRLGHMVQSQVVLQDNFSKHRIMVDDVVNAEAEFKWRHTTI